MRISPPIEWVSHARVSGTDRAVKWRAYAVPTTAGNVDLVIERDLGAGAGYASFATLTTSSPTQAVSGITAARFIVTNTSGGLFFDSNNSRIVLGSSSELLINATPTTQPLVMRSATTSAGVAAFRLWASSADRSATEVVVEIGDGVFPTFNVLFRVMGDGVAEAPAFHLDATVRTAGTFTAALHTLHRVDLSGADVTATLPEATDANAGRELMIAQTVAGTGNLVLGRAAGNIEGAAADLTIAGLASAPYRSVRLISCGAAFGWKVARTT